MEFISNRCGGKLYGKSPRINSYGTALRNIRILNYVYRLVKKREDAEDLAQETFIHLYANISRIDPENNFRAWLYKIATNVVYDWWRKRKNIKEISLINFICGSPPHAPRRAERGSPRGGE
ncbi:MAG: RNA polymerase sigma factor [Candidatus Wolfebacteria bacterium]|nr:RNA polymerase sigma factor [Candidatus Wolfebacteria bacterium]